MHCNRFKIFGAHNRTNATAASGTVQIVDYAGVAYTLFTGNTDRGHLKLRVLMALLNGLLGVPYGCSPQIVRWQQLYLVVDYMQIDRAGRTSFKN